MTFDLSSLTLLGASRSTNDWLRFRGPNGSGVSETAGIPAVFGAGRNLSWKTSVPFGRSSPVVAGNRIFLTASEGEKLITLCLDRISGKIIWRAEAARARHMPIFKGNDAASPTPVSDGTNVYVFFAELGLISYGPDGRERWRAPLGPFNNFYGIGSSPVLAGDTLVMVCDQRTNPFVIAVDVRDGSVRWKIDRSSPVEGYATPIIYSPSAGEPQILVFGSHALEAYALKTGERLWWVGGIGYAPKGVPVLGRELVYVSAPGGDAPVFPPFEEGLKQFDSNGDQRVQFEETRSDPVHSRALRVDGSQRRRRHRAQRIRRRSERQRRGPWSDRNPSWWQGERVIYGHRVEGEDGVPNVPAPLLYKDVLYAVKTGGVITSLKPRDRRCPQNREKRIRNGGVLLVSGRCRQQGVHDQR